MMQFSAFIAHGLWLELFHVHLSSRLQCFNVHFAMQISFKCTCGREFRVETSVTQRMVGSAVEHSEKPEHPATAQQSGPNGRGPEEERAPGCGTGQGSSSSWLRPQPPPSDPPGYLYRFSERRTSRSRSRRGSL